MEKEKECIWFKSLCRGEEDAYKELFVKFYFSLNSFARKHLEVKEKYIVELSQKEEYDFFLNQILEEEVYTLLKEAIDSLPGQMKRVYELALLGHSNEEIAKILSISVDAVKALKKRGKKILQEKLKYLIYLLLPFI